MRSDKSDSRIRRAITKLYGDRAKEYGKRYYQNRRLLSVGVVVISVILSLVYYLSGINQSEILNGKYIRRNEKDGIAKTVNIEAESSSGYREDIRLVVESMHYTTEELDEMLVPFKEELIRQIVPPGQSLDGVSSDMNLVSKVSGYPFDVSWKSDKPGVLSASGKVDAESNEAKENKNSGTIVTITAVVTYSDYEKEILIPVKVIPVEKSEEELFWEAVDEEIKLLSDGSITEEYQKLPSEVKGQRMTYSEKTDFSAIVIIIMGVLAAFLIGAGRDEELLKKSAMRDEQLKKDFPQFINRIALYYGAGLSVKNIWQKMCADYEQKKQFKGSDRRPDNRVVYEEMLKCDKKMRDGLGEEDAYEQFAKNIGIVEYTSLVNILQQAVKTGGSNIASLLKDRRREAFENQKKRAKILGEKAGTKLLAPMFMMLMIVLVVILVPAFISF